MTSFCLLALVLVAHFGPCHSEQVVALVAKRRPSLKTWCSGLCQRAPVFVKSCTSRPLHLSVMINFRKSHVSNIAVKIVGNTQWRHASHGCVQGTILLCTHEKSYSVLTQVESPWSRNFCDQLTPTTPNHFLTLEPRSLNLKAIAVRNKKRGPTLFWAMSNG